MLLSIQGTRSLPSVRAPWPADDPIDFLRPSHSHATCHDKFVAHTWDTSYRLERIVTF